MPGSRDSLPKKSLRFSKVTDAGLKELARLTNSWPLAHHARGQSARRVVTISDSADQMAGISIVASNHHVKWYACRGRELFQTYGRCARHLDLCVQVEVPSALRSDIHEEALVKTGTRRARDFPDTH
jgi:hypothetical protein